jgi:hypothetical protein
MKSMTRFMGMVSFSDGACLLDRFPVRLSDAESGPAGHSDGTTGPPEGKMVLLSLHLGLDRSRELAFCQRRAATEERSQSWGEPRKRSVYDRTLELRFVPELAMRTMHGRS